MRSSILPLADRFKFPYNILSIRKEKRAVVVRKKSRIFLFAVVLSTLSPLRNAYAADSDAVTTINFTTSYTPEEMSIPEDAYKITAKDWKIDLTEVTMLNDPVINEPIEFQVTVTALNNHTFHGLKLGSLRSNFNAEFQSLVISDDEKTCQIKFTMQPPKVQLKQAKNLQWDGTMATWNSVEAATNYELELHTINSHGKESSTIKTFTTDLCSFDLADYIYERPGDYIFSVKTLSSTKDCFVDSKRSIMDFNNSLLITEADVGISKGYWVTDKDQTRYKTGDKNEILKDGIYQIKGHYYSMDSDGNVQYGWQTSADGTIHYFTPETGCMVKGFQFIDGQNYLFLSTGALAKGWTQVEDQWYYSNPDGIIQTGWQLIDRKWYYLYADGAMNTQPQLYCSNGILATFNQDGSLKRTTPVKDIVVDK